MISEVRLAIGSTQVSTESWIDRYFNQERGEPLYELLFMNWIDQVPGKIIQNCIFCRFYSIVHLIYKCLGTLENYLIYIYIYIYFFFITIITLYL